MEKPKFSVIIPAHNEEDVIQKAVDSVLDQTFKDFEIIVVNDGSKDKTREIVEKLMREHSNIRIINFNEGHSAAFSRNRGAEAARGEILVFLDADTFISINTLDEISNSKLDADAFAFDCLPKNKTIVSYALSGLVVQIFSRQEIYSSKDRDPFMFFCIKKEAFEKIKGYDETIFYFEDSDFSKRFYHAGFKTAFLKNAYQYFELPSTFSGFIRQCKWIAKGMNSLKDSLKRKKLKLFWLAKSLFFISPIFFILNLKLALYALLITLAFSYLLLIKRNKNPVKSAVSLPFLYIKTIFICFELLKYSILQRTK